MSDSESAKTRLVDRAFPFHVAVDQQMSIVEVGPRLRSLLAADPIGRPLDQVLRIDRPLTAPDFDHIKEAVDEVQVLDVIEHPGLRLRGEFIPDMVGSEDVLRFIGHPWITDLAELSKFGLDLRDFPPHVGLGDLLILLQVRNNSLEDMKRLATQLRATTRELEERNVSLEQELEARRRLEAQLQQAQKMEAIGRLAGGVAHDFNNVLLAITGYTSLAQREEDRELAKAHLDKVLDAADRAAGITSRLLTFARRKRLEVTDVQLDEALSESDMMLRPLIGEQIDLDTQCAPNAGSIHVDPVALQQVIMNLVVNARDAMPEGGRIEVRAHQETSSTPQVLFSGERAAGKWGVISVRDFGAGIDPADIDRVFEPFFTTKQLGQGTGLGLATVWWITSESGGQVDMQSTPGEGTMVTIHIPAGVDVVDLNVDDAPGAFPKLSILVVEDDAMVRAPLVELLQVEGCKVQSASCAAEAIQIAQEKGTSFECLLCDVILPDSNGREVAKQLRELIPGLKVVMMSGYDPGTGAEITEGTPTLSKPFSLEELRQAFERAV